MNKGAVEQCFCLEDFFCGSRSVDVANSNHSPDGSRGLTGPLAPHVSSCCREGEILRISLPLKTILAQIKCSNGGFTSSRARAKYLQGSVSCGILSTAAHIAVKTVVRANKSQPATLFF